MSLHSQKIENVKMEIRANIKLEKKLLADLFKVKFNLDLCKQELLQLENSNS